MSSFPIVRVSLLANVTSSEYTKFLRPLSSAVKKAFDTCKKLEYLYFNSKPETNNYPINESNCN